MHYSVNSLDALQRKFLTSLMQVRKNDGEPYDAFIQRRHLIGGHLATACGRRSHAWARSDRVMGRPRPAGSR